MNIPPRKQLIERVSAALASPFGPPLYLHGPPSTAKQSTLRATVPTTCKFTTIDCILCHTDRLLYSAILPDADPPVTDAISLVDALSSSVEPTSTDKHVIVFTRAERLASAAFSATTLSFLFQLPQVANRSDIRIVLISRVPFSAIRHVHVHPLDTPDTIFFPPLTEHEIVAAIQYDARRLPHALPEEVQGLARDVYPGYAKSVVNILYTSTNNPHHVQRVADELFPQYIAPFIGSNAKFNAMAAFNRVRDSLTDVLKTLNPLVSSLEAQGIATTEDDKTSNLPRAARILLVSAYLATVIAPSQDMRHFSVERTSKKAGLQKAAANNAVPLERLLAVYAAVCPQQDEMPSVTAQAHSVSAVLSTAALIHLSTLVALGFLTREGGHDTMTEPKYRSRLNRDEAVSIANKLQLNIHDYLVFDK